MSQINKQKEFMQAFGMRHHKVPTLDLVGAILWSRLMDEEMTELTEAWDSFVDNPQSEKLQAELTAEVVDVLYTLMGFAHSQGLPIEAMFDAIHNANIRKLNPDGSVTRNAAGKVMKPEGWLPADKVAIIRRATEKADKGVE